MDENPYAPPSLPAQSGENESASSHVAKSFIVGATALFLEFVSFQSLSLAWTWAQTRLHLEDWKLPGEWDLAYLAIVPATMLTIWLARLTWRSERWDWWASLQIGISLTVWTVLAMLDV